MGVFLGALSSLLFGVGDFVGGEASKRTPASTVVFWAGLLSFPFISIAALVVGGSATWADMAYGVGAGMAGAIGLVLLFVGLAKGHAAAVSPASAAVMAVFPVSVAVILGERPSMMAWLGVLIAIPAIILCSWAANPGEVRLGGLWYGVAAGIGFGIYVVLISRTAEASNLLPLIPARLATVAVVVVLALGGVLKVRRFAATPRALVLANGLLDVTGNVAFILGLRMGSLALVSVVAATSPAVTVVLAAVINKERLRSRQIVGLVLVLVALALIILG